MSDTAKAVRVDPMTKALYGDAIPAEHDDQGNHIATIKLGRNDSVPVDLENDQEVAAYLAGLNSDNERDQSIALGVADEVQKRASWLSLDLPQQERFAGFFDAVTTSFTRYRVEGVFNNYIAGGIPKDQDLIEKWLRAKGGLVEEGPEIQRAILATMEQRRNKFATVGGTETDVEGQALELAKAAAAEIANETKGNGFKSDSTGGLYFEGRQPKAMIREATNILFAGQRWGDTKKGPRSMVAETVFVEDHRIYLGRSQPDMTVPFTGHVVGQQGARSTLTYYDVCIQPEFVITIRVANDPKTGNPKVSQADLLRILEHSQWLGIGALRSQGFGTWTLRNIELLRYRKEIESGDLSVSERYVDVEGEFVD